MKSLITVLFLFSFQFSYAQTNLDSLALAVGSAIESSYYKDEGAYFISIFNDEKFHKKVLIEDSKNVQLSIINAGMRREKTSVKFAERMVQEINAGTYYNFVNYYTTDDFQYLIFRVYGEGGMNYHELELSLNEKSEPEITDIFIYLSGEFYSETLKSLYLSIADSVLEEDSKGEIDFDFESFKQIKKINKLLAKGKTEKAKKLFDNKISDDFKNTKLGLFMNLKFIDTNDPLGYTLLLERLIAETNSPAGVYLAFIDYYLLSGEHDKAMAAVDSIYTYTEDDFLDLYRGNIEFMADNHTKSIEYFEKVVTNYPQLPEIYDSLLAMYELQKDSKNIIYTLERLIKNLGWEKADLKTIFENGYEELLKDEAILKWWQSDSTSEKK